MVILKQKQSVIMPNGTKYTFQQLNQLCNYYAHSFSNAISRDTRVLLMLKPGLELFAATYALLKLGAVPVFIDPGIGLSNFWQCVNEADPVAFISSSRLLRTIIKLIFRKINIIPLPNHSIENLLLEDMSIPVIKLNGNEQSEAAIVFTSGSTGIPKGVIYSYGMLNAQLQIFRDIGLEAGEVDLPCLYIFAMFNPLLGITTVIPDMDPRHPAKLDPAKIIQNIEKYQVTTSFGSPVIWKKISEYCHKHNLTLPSIRRIFIAGAPVPNKLIEQIKPLLPNGNILIPYGATEALPITLHCATDDISYHETKSPLWDENREYSLCVGKPLNGITLKIIPITNYVIEEWDDSLCLPEYEIGEVVVKGPVVTHIYINRPYQTVMAKIKDKNQIWHRMGDMGFLDKEGNLWFCGRKSHRVETEHGLLYPIPCEAIFNQHPLVARSALVGVGPLGHQRPIIFIEPKDGFDIKPNNQLGLKIRSELIDMGQSYIHTKIIRDIRFHPKFPVDVRHNAKIQREKLALLASK